MSKELVPRPAPPREAGPLDAVLGATRFAAQAWFRGATWSVGVSIRLARSWRDPQASSALARDLVDTLRGLAQELLEVSDMTLEARIRRLLPPAAAPVDARASNGRVSDPLELRRQAAELLQQAAEIGPDEAAHPAFARILLELAPDEARILRLLAREGPQPAVDVRAIGMIRSGEVVASGLNMVGPAAGARHPDRVPVYLDNLGRLGLIRFSSQPLEDEIAYQVLEAQPDVLSTLRDTSRARTIQRSIRLTPFGQEFCRLCLPPDQHDPTSPRPG